MLVYTAIVHVSGLAQWKRKTIFFLLTYSVHFKYSLKYQSLLNRKKKKISGFCSPVYFCINDKISFLFHGEVNGPITDYPHSTEYCRNMSEIFSIFIAIDILSQHFRQILENISLQHYNFNFLIYFL